jgi:hypothetical protein
LAVRTCCHDWSDGCNKDRIVGLGNTGAPINMNGSRDFYPIGRAYKKCLTQRDPHA